MRWALVALALIALSGCAPDAPVAPAPSPPVTASGPASATPTPRRLPANGRFDYQIGGAYEPDADVAVVDRDRSEAPVPGRFNVCYVNAFQTQPEEADFWTGQHPELLVRRDGRPLTDPGWPDEHLLDTSTAAKREALLAVVGAWFDGCATSGYQAVEPDNLDSWTRSHGLLTRDDNVAFATLLAARAHERGLLVGQKNTSELGSEGRTKIRFDFAVAEECQVYDECDAYTDVYGDQVVEVEYTDNPRSAFTGACRERGALIAVVLRDRDVVPRGHAGYVDEAC